MLPYWLEPFFTAWPAYAFFFLGVGVPWALVLLPRDEWTNHPTVLATGLALGPLLSTTWLFLLGTFGRLEAERALTGLALLALVGLTGAWLRRHKRFRPPHTRPEPWTGLERALVVMMIAAFAVHIFITMWWPFVQYDTLWTFGYNARVFVLEEHIPERIDYYPQLVPLTYTYGQMLHGGINDYVAKAAVPWFMLASVLMAYMLGLRVWGVRRIGILTAALWMLVPSALFWSGAGDLEHPMALYFTGAVAFFILAWRSHHPRHALLSGLLFAGAVWTKPTGGAFALGVLLVVGVMGVRLFLPDRWREQLGVQAVATPRRQIFWQKFRVAALTGLASLPIGGMWYVRNMAVGHAPITFPPGLWHDFAQRSGQEFGWVILSVLCAAFILLRHWTDGHRVDRLRARTLALCGGIALLLLGTLPSALVLDAPWDAYSAWDWVFGARTQPERLNALEVALIVAGLGLFAWSVLPAWQRTTERARSSGVLAVLLILPFTVVWFWNYSYHYRLMLTITPVLASLVAAELDAGLVPLMSRNALRRRALVAIAVALSIPALVIASYLTIFNATVMNVQTTADKYRVSNPELMEVVEIVRAEIDQRPVRAGQLNIFTLGENRLNFFFPEMQYIDDTVYTDLSAFHPWTDLVIGGTLAEQAWRAQGVWPNPISAQMAMGFQYSRPHLEYANGSIMHTYLNPIGFSDFGNHRLVTFEAYYPYRQYTLDELQMPVRFAGDQWPGLALRGLDIRRPVFENGQLTDTRPIVPGEDGVLGLQPGDDIFIQLYWQRTSERPIARTHSIFIHLIDPRTGDLLTQRDGVILDGQMPLSALPYPDIVADRRRWQLPPDLPLGPLDLHIGVYDALAPGLPRWTVQDGPWAGGDGVWLRARIVMTPPTAGNPNTP
ncbi:MAG: hypothetical protein ACLFTK_12770 [Anaerolineales bacterium]